jgi:hypothetical protein
MPNEASASEEPAQKRAREDRASSSEQRKAKPSTRNHGETSEVRAGNGFPNADLGGGTWNEHRDAVGSIADVLANALGKLCGMEPER